MDKSKKEDHESISEETIPRYHPSYPVDDLGDLVLLSIDGVHFHVHSVVLHLSSAFFRGMLDIPRKSSESARDAIPMEETAGVIAGLLDIIYPNAILRDEAIRETIDLHAENLTAAADKYEMPAVIAMVKKVLFDGKGQVPSINDHWSAIRRYDLARKFEWKNEEHVSARWTLHQSLTAPEALSELRRVCADSVLRLQELHRKRLEKYITTLVEIASLAESRTKSCSIPYWKKCQCLLGCVSWQIFIYKVSDELRSEPLGLRLINSTWDDEGYAQIFEIKHTTPCFPLDSAILNKIDFVAQAQFVLKGLPTFI